MTSPPGTQCPHSHSATQPSLRAPLPTFQTRVMSEDHRTNNHLPFQELTDVICKTQKETARPSPPLQRGAYQRHRAAHPGSQRASSWASYTSLCTTSPAGRVVLTSALCAAGTRGRMETLLSKEKKSLVCLIWFAVCPQEI